MKRFLSLILAIMMVATLLPTAVFATEGEAADAGITITYDITSRCGEWAKQTYKFAEFTYESNNGLWEYAANSKNLESIDASVFNWNGTNGLQTTSGWWAIKIIVPKSGMYTPNIQYRKYRYGGMLGLYLISTDEGKLSDSMMTEETCIGEVSCFEKDLNPAVTENKDLERRYIEAGEYYLVYKNNGTAGYSGTNFVFMLNFALNGNGTDTVLTSMFTPEKLIVPMGTLSQIIPEFYLNDGNVAAGEYTVSYANDNPDVAIVDTNGVVTSNTTGNATITATVTNEAGVTLKAVTDVEVVDGATIKYDLRKHIHDDLGYYSSTNGIKGSLSAVNENLTNGFYSYFGGNDYDGSKVKYYASVQIMGTGVKIAFKINVPEAGYYNFMQEVFSTTTKRMNCDISVYINKDAISTATTDFVGKTNAYKPEITDGTKLLENVGQVYFEEPGSYIVTFCMGPKLDSTQETQHGLVCSFYLVGGTHDALMNGAITSTASSINVDEGETATVSATGYLSSTAEATTAFTYSSSNEKIATVDATSGAVTPKSEGKVTITATATDAEVANKLTTDITVTVNKPGEAVADTTISVYIDALTGGEVTTNLENEVSEVEIGTKVEATATAADGYEFAYWADSTGKVLSTKAEETFTINVNTSVIAYFEKLVSETDTTAPVYFYNGNRELLEKADVEKGKTFGELIKPTASLTGFEFSGWSINDADIINDITRAVALFKDSGKTYTVKVGDTTVASEKKYGDTVTVESTASDFVCWKLGEKVMSYDKSFTFDVYGDITLTEVTGEAEKAVPTVVLDTVGGEYFLAYEVPTGYTKVEAGILFAESGTPTIGSFYSKATEKTGSGQFTAKPNGSEGVARGYMIFRDADNTIRVIYAD